MEQKTVDIRELGARLEQLLEDVKAGATLVITDQGKPVARILPSRVYGLKGYDAVQLAAATSWQESLGVPLTLATFDVQLWNAAARAKLDLYPPDLPALLDSWKGVALS